MFDSITPLAIPGDAQAVAGYMGGDWPTFAGLAKLFPHAHRLGVAISLTEDGDALDIEHGDVDITDAAGIIDWIHRAILRGVVRPVLYCSISSVPALLDILAQGSVPRASVRLWSAHATNHAHICDASCYPGLPAGYESDATQWTFAALGRNLDESLCMQSFFTAAPPKRKRTVKVSLPPPVKHAAAAVKPTKKVAAATGGGGVAVAVIGLLHAFAGAHGLTPAEWAATSAAVAAASGWLAPKG
jgi:hypothetical protein